MSLPDIPNWLAWIFGVASVLGLLVTIIPQLFGPRGVGRHPTLRRWRRHTYANAVAALADFEKTANTACFEARDAELAVVREACAQALVAAASSMTSYSQGRAALFTVVDTSNDRTISIAATELAGTFLPVQLLDGFDRRRYAMQPGLTDDAVSVAGRAAGRFSVQYEAVDGERFSAGNWRKIGTTHIIGIPLQQGTQSLTVGRWASITVDLHHRKSNLIARLRIRRTVLPRARDLAELGARLEDLTQQRVV